VPNEAMEDRAKRRIMSNGDRYGADDAIDDDAPRRTGEVRVDAVAAAVAAGLVDPELESEASVLASAESVSVALPDWTDPPTGQVPRVLLPEGGDPDAQRLKGPSWRQSAQDWEGETDTLEFLVAEVEEDDVDERTMIAGRQSTFAGNGDPFEFDFEPPTLHPRTEPEIDPADDGEEATVSAVADDAAWSDVIDPESRRRHGRSGVHRTRAASTGSSRRKTSVAVATGVVLAGVAVGCFEAGPLAVLVLATVALSLAAGETFGAIRQGGYRPLSFLGIVATALCIVFAYLKGPIADPVLLAGFVVLAGIALVASAQNRAAVEDFGVTIFVVIWVGVLGSFAALLVNPTTFAHRHGVAFFGAAVGLTVAHDIGSYVVGARFGRHRFAPHVSPGKSVEGLLGGSVLTLLVAGLLVSRVHPLSLAASLGLGALVVVLAPLGDLLESAVKRDLGLKDMSRLLPAHGGIADRIDALLFVLPASYVFFRLVHLG
jgi:phosphatidate cytidylyltransferase